MEDSPRKNNSHAEASNAADAACLDTVEDMDTSGPEPLTLPADVCKVSILWINGSTNSVTLAFVGEEFRDQLFQFEELLQSEFNKGQLQPITTGMMCVAFYKGQFNRAHVGSIEGEKVNCFFPDHGDSASLTPEHLRPLDPEVNRKLPYQAIKVSMHGLHDIAYSTTAITALRDLTLGKTCIAIPMYWDENKSWLSVVLFDTTDDKVININEEIRIRFNTIKYRSTISPRGL
ncbi:hypothetical protein ACJMK2_010298 [Sinanodonta woodiana]|uniref:Tudor domain-containing protein n=1 Tax=Sinanodonta woodiana TaxID=1069815 RepID=A0ABD3VGG6_SINWO